MSYDLLDRVYSIMIDVMTGVSAGSGNAIFYNTDSHTSFIELSITNGTQSFNMSEYNYQLVISKPDKTVYNNNYTTTDNSKLVIALDSDMLSGIGNNIAQLYVMKTINDVNKVVTMIEFNYTVKAGNYSALAPESVNQDSMYIALRTDVDSILSKIENGELGGGSGGTGLTATQAEQLATAYEHSQSPHITTADVNNAVSTYVTAHKAELKGDKGDKGDAGEKGDTGAKGDKGDKGDTGATGAKGVTPTLKVGSTTTGNAGTNAVVTMTDSNNVYTLNFVIPKGDKGDTGAKGDAGAKGQDGAKGADGITPTLKVGTVTTLAAGSNATVTMSENNNVYTLNFGIPKGNKGDTGASGGSGETTVVNPTITIGTVTNGDTASATITGDSPNYTLNLVLPKGDKGDKGDTGEAGSGGDVDLTGYAELTGATFTGNISSPIVAATKYFVTPTLVGEGDDSKYFHRVVFGHRNFDKMEFHEYGGLFRFLENKSGGVDDGRLLFQISPSDVNSSVPLKENGVRVYSPNNKPTAADLGITTGTNGATFTPAVDSEGNLSWSNDKDLANPNTVNIKGATGAKGDKGDKGEKGDTGAKGADGKTPNISIGTVTTGAAGTNASATISGTTPNLTLDLTIPKGDKGSNGINGQTPKISIGTVTTGAAGSSASASISGTTPNLTLNLTIPKGDKGDKGADGTVSKTVKTLTSASSVTLTTDEYQYLYGNMDMTLALPNIATTTDITELHLFYLPNAVRTLTFSTNSIKWQNSVPNIEANKWYEFIFTRTHSGVWLAGVVVYG